ncbi:MAG: pantetheine-phosphate adenylyltransferase [Deltaproteobacteria bacterium]|nr:pantetheine-phosphate adenylyltransferase [Deltaproteobacteria bacterium]
MPTRKRAKGSPVRAVPARETETLEEPVAIYPGSFDPITNGHIDIIRRALRVFPRVTVAVAYNPNKDAAMFTPAERVAMIRQAFADVGERVVADSFTGLLVDYAERIGAQVLIRGLRAVSDFEYEFQMTMMNRHLKPKIETVFMMAGEQYFYTSSRLVKEVATFGGDVRNLVPEFVLQRFGERITKKAGEKRV